MKSRVNHPINQQVIPVHYDGGQRWFTHEYVTVFRFNERCTRTNCPNDAEHVTFDGQVFFRRGAQS